jgi:hypothetical protein
MIWSVARAIRWVISLWLAPEQVIPRARADYADEAPASRAERRAKTRTFRSASHKQAWGGPRSVLSRLVLLR